MAEIELDAQGEGSRDACYRDEGMSPPAGHAVLVADGSAVNPAIAA
jgi:hypothetical protein